MNKEIKKEINTRKGAGYFLNSFYSNSEILEFLPFI
jgi:hypothetical protein